MRVRAFGLKSAFVLFAAAVCGACYSVDPPPTPSAVELSVSEVRQDSILRSQMRRETERPDSIYQERRIREERDEAARGVFGDTL